MTHVGIWQIAGWTMLHYLWVGGVLGVIAAVLRRALWGAGANLRYLAALSCFAVLGIAPLPIAVVVTNSLPPLPRSEAVADRMPMLPALPATEMPVEHAVTLPTLVSSPPSTPVPDHSPQPIELLQSVLNRAALSLPWLWVFGTPMTFLLITLGLLGAERLRRQSRLLEDDPITETCRRLAAALRISQRVGVGICDRIAAPILVGIFRPLILLPAALAGWDGGQLEMVLLHELAHVRRFDNLVNLIQRITESLLFFHPMVWIASGWVRREREHCCDELVVARTRQPHAYVEILVHMSDQVAASPFAFARTVSSMAERSLVARTRRILKNEEQTMQVSRKTVGLMFVGLLAIAMIGGYCSLASRAEVPVAGKEDAQGESDPKLNSTRDGDSRAWYVLSQVDTDGLLLGLPQRLGKTIIASRHEGPMWSGVENGGRLTLDVQVEGDAKGEIFIGFFEDPRWWVAEPVQIRRVPGPGRYTFDRLLPGKYQLGAILGTLPKPIALGVHATWPAPVEIAGRRAAEARMLVSTKFENRPAGAPGLEEGFAGQWGKLDPSRTITVRNVDSAGLPVPFCRVTFVDRGNGTETLWFHEAGRDDQGRAYCDKIDQAFSLCVQRFDFLPGKLESRYESRKMAKIYNAQDRPNIAIKWDQLPAGTAKLVGQVHDQDKQPLRQYYLTLTRQIGEQHDWSDATSYGISLPVIQPDGRFEVTDLPSGTYTAMVRAFDYSAYAWTFDGPKVAIPDEPHAVVQFNVEMEARKLFYGRAVYDDGTSVSRGSWTTVFKKDITDRFGGKGFSMPIEKDGSFRVSLSREERQQLVTTSNGMVDVSAHAPEVRIQVPISDLSKDPARPFKVVMPKPRTSGGDKDSTSTFPGQGMITESTASFNPSTPKANDESGKSSAKPADEVPPAKVKSATKEGSETESKPAPAHGIPALERNTEEVKAIAEIVKLGGKVTFDEKSPGKPVIYLDFSESKVTDAGLAHLKQLPTLKSLNLRGTKITDAGLANLKGLRQLQSLNLTATEVKDAGLENLKGLLQLQSLNLQVTEITDAGLVQLEGLTQLRDLNLYNTRVTNAGLAHLQEMTQLTSLNLWHTHVTDTGLECLKGLLRLHSLNLMHTDVTDKGLANVKRLTQLQMLDLSATRVTDAGLAHLEHLTNLQSLNLGYTKVSDAGLAYLKGLTQLQSLWLGETQVTDAGLAYVKGLTELQTLDLGETQVADAALADLKELTKLQWLDLCVTKITDAGLTHLERLTKLRGLYLVNTKVNDAGLEHLKGLTQLRWLYLGGTQVTDAGVKKLQQVLPNCKIDRTILDENTPASTIPSQGKTVESAAASPSSAASSVNDQSSKTPAARPANETSGTGDEKAPTDLPRGASPAAKTADNASAANEKRRKELADLGIVMPPDYMSLPAYRKLDMSDVRRHFGITAAQEKKLREIAAAFQAEESKLMQAYEEWHGVPPQERKTAPEEWRTKFEKLGNAYRKPIEDVLTAEQRTAYKHDILAPEQLEKLDKAIEEYGW